MQRTFVASEFAPLKRVVLAQSQFYIPKKNLAETNFLAADSSDVIHEGVFGDIADLYPDLQARWENEKKAMADLLTSYGIEVLRPRLLTAYEKQLGIETDQGYANFFSRDPFFTIGEYIIEGNLRFPHRKFEILPMRELLLNEIQGNATYFAAPQPDISQGPEKQIGPFIEGGDVLVYGKTIFVGYSGLASNLVGIQWLENLLKKWDYQVMPVRLHPDILHLDCALSLVREGLMICCEDAFLDGIPEVLQNWDKINISLNDAAHLMANGLPINEEVYITDQAFTSLIEQLTNFGVKVETLDYYVSRLFGGSFRCTTQAFLREE